MTPAQKKTHINANDRRVKRTKKALRESLIKLLDEKSVNQITVTELTELADVNRATFYFYYSDIIDMLQQIQDEVYAEFEELINSIEDFSLTDEGLTEYIKAIMVYISKDLEMCRFVLENDVNHNLQRKIQALMISIVPNSESIFPADKPAHYATKFALNGVIGSIIAWLTEDAKADIDELAAFIAGMYLHGSVEMLHKN